MNVETYNALDTLRVQINQVERDKLDLTERVKRLQEELSECRKSHVGPGSVRVMLDELEAAMVTIVSNAYDSGRHSLPMTNGGFPGIYRHRIAGAINAAWVNFVEQAPGASVPDVRNIGIALCKLQTALGDVDARLGEAMKAAGLDGL